MRKILLSMAPVSHENREVPPKVNVPLKPEDVAREVLQCARMGVSMVHLHVRDEQGRQTSDLRHYSKTLDLIRESSDIIIQGSTGGVADLSLDERCVSLNDARTEIASLNMGSSNLGEGVYINTLPDIRYWAKKMISMNVMPEFEIFDLSMIDSVKKIAGEGLVSPPFSINFCMGFENAIPALPERLFALVGALPENSHWGIIHDNMTDLSLLACAAGMGASVLRFGFEDSFYFGLGKLAISNMELLKPLLELLRLMDIEPMTPSEARKFIGINPL